MEREDHDLIADFQALEVAGRADLDDLPGRAAVAHEAGVGGDEQAAVGPVKVEGRRGRPVDFD